MISETNQLLTASAAARAGFRGPRAALSSVPGEQLETLRSWTEESDRRKSLRARIIVLSAGGLSAMEVSRTLEVGVPTVYKWRRRFAKYGLAGLSDLPRSGQPRRLPKAVREEIVRVTRDEKPPQGQRWSIRVAARHWGVTQHQIRQVWSEAALRPHSLRSSRA